MSENALWKRMRAGVIENCFVQRIENMVGAGVPDVLLHDRVTGKEAWVELKYRPLRPKRPGAVLFSGDYGLRPDQQAWIYGRATAGVNAWILAQCGDDLYLVHGVHARGLEGMDAEALRNNCAWVTSARGTDW